MRRAVVRRVRLRVPALQVQARCCLHGAVGDGGYGADTAAAQELLQGLQAEARSAAPVFRPQHLHDVVTLIDGLDHLHPAATRTPPALPGADDLPPPPLKLELEDEADSAEAAKAEDTLARVLAARETTLGEHVLAVVAAAPGEPTDRADMLIMLAHALSSSPWLSGQLVTAVARREAHAASRSSGLTITNKLLGDWVSYAACEPAGPEAAGMARVLLSVLEAAVRCTNVEMALRVLAQLQQFSGGDQVPLLAAYKLFLTMAARCSATEKVQECFSPVRAALADPEFCGAEDAEFQTLMFRAEVAALSAATKRDEPAQIRTLAAQGVAALRSADLQPEDAFFISWIDAHAAAGHFEKEYLSIVDGVLEAAAQPGHPPAPHVCAALLAGVLSNPKLKPRALHNRLKAVERKFAAAGWTGHTEESYYELLKALAYRQQVGCVAALEVMQRMRNNGLVPSTECYRAVVTGLLQDGAVRKHAAAPWSVAETAALRLAVARYVSEPELGEPLARQKDPEKPLKKWTRATYTREKQQQAEWKLVAEAVGNGRSSRACHRRWSRLNQALQLKTEGSTTGLECSVEKNLASATAQDPATLPSLDEQDLLALEEAIRKSSDKHRQWSGQNQQNEEQLALQHRTARQKDWGLKAAIKCLRQMLKEGHPKELSLDLCNAILKCCVANFRPWIALSLLDQMKKWGLEPDQTSLNYTVQACVRVKVGFTGRAVRLLDDVSVQPMDATWVTLLNACLASPHARAWEATVAVADRAVSCKLAEVCCSHNVY